MVVLIVVAVLRCCCGCLIVSRGDGSAYLEHERGPLIISSSEYLNESEHTISLSNNHNNNNDANNNINKSINRLNFSNSVPINTQLIPNNTTSSYNNNNKDSTCHRVSIYLKRNAEMGP